MCPQLPVNMTHWTGDTVHCTQLPIPTTIMMQTESQKTRSGSTCPYSRRYPCPIFHTGARACELRLSQPHADRCIHLDVCIHACFPQTHMGLQARDTLSAKHLTEVEVFHVHVLICSKSIWMNRLHDTLDRNTVHCTQLPIPTTII